MGVTADTNMNGVGQDAHRTSHIAHPSILPPSQIFSSGLGKGVGNYVFQESASPETSSFPPVCTIVGVLLFRHPQALVACTRKQSLGQTH